MKKTFAIIFILFIAIAATKPNDERKSANESRIEGTWELVSHYIYDGKDIIDTIYAEKDYRQIKMYYNGKVMWTRFVPSVSAEWFGYGSYSTQKNRLRETLEYGSATMMKIQDTVGVFEFELLINKDSYSQIFIDRQGNRLHSENYRRVDEKQKGLFNTR